MSLSTYVSSRVEVELIERVLGLMNADFKHLTSRDIEEIARAVAGKSGSRFRSNNDLGDVVGRLTNEITRHPPAADTVAYDKARQACAHYVDRQLGAVADGIAKAMSKTYATLTTEVAVECDALMENIRAHAQKAATADPLDAYTVKDVSWGVIDPNSATYIAGTSIMRDDMHVNPDRGGAFILGIAADRLATYAPVALEEETRKRLAAEGFSSPLFQAVVCDPRQFYLQVRQIQKQLSLRPRSDSFVSAIEEHNALVDDLQRLSSLNLSEWPGNASIRGNIEKATNYAALATVGWNIVREHSKDLGLVYAEESQTIHRLNAELSDDVVKRHVAYCKAVKRDIHPSGELTKMVMAMEKAARMELDTIAHEAKINQTATERRVRLHVIDRVLSDWMVDVKAYNKGALPPGVEANHRAAVEIAKAAINTSDDFDAALTDYLVNTRRKPLLTALHTNAAANVQRLAVESDGNLGRNDRDRMFALAAAQTVATTLQKFKIPA